MFLVLHICFLFHDNFTVSLELHIFLCVATAGSVHVPIQGIWPGLFHLSSEGWSFDYVFAIEGF